MRKFFDHFIIMQLAAWCCFNYIKSKKPQHTPIPQTRHQEAHDLFKFIVILWKSENDFKRTSEVLLRMSFSFENVIWLDPNNWVGNHSLLDLVLKNTCEDFCYITNFVS